MRSGRRREAKRRSTGAAGRRDPGRVGVTTARAVGCRWAAKLLTASVHCGPKALPQRACPAGSGRCRSACQIHRSAIPGRRCIHRAAYAGCLKRNPGRSARDWRSTISLRRAHPDTDGSAPQCRMPGSDRLRAAASAAAGFRLYEKGRCVPGSPGCCRDFGKANRLTVFGAGCCIEPKGPKSFLAQAELAHGPEGQAQGEITHMKMEPKSRGRIGMTPAAPAAAWRGGGLDVSPRKVGADAAGVRRPSR